MNRDGSFANWSRSGSHTLSAELRVAQATKKVCVGQVHLGTGGSSTKPLLELYYEPSGDITIGVERSPSGGQPSHVPAVHSIRREPAGWACCPQRNRFSIKTNPGTHRPHPLQPQRRQMRQQHRRQLHKGNTKLINLSRSRN